jgi:NFU1 iron-sulfur cluster scaffold homolog, mitochondrial
MRHDATPEPESAAFVSTVSFAKQPMRCDTTSDIQDRTEPWISLFQLEIKCIMASAKVMKSALNLLVRPRPAPAALRHSILRTTASRCQACGRTHSTVARAPLRAGSLMRQVRSSPTGLPSIGRRTIFIQTENTPNTDALKFIPNHRVLPPEIPVPFVEYMNARATIAPPYPSPLAAQLMNVDGVTSVFYGADFITVTKASDAHWAHIRPEVFALITEAVTSGQTIVNVAERKAGEVGEETAEEDTLSYNENDSEVVGMIKELLETRIRPAIQEDGGDIEYRGFEDGYVRLKLRGACRTCDSSTVTLKNGIEGMLMHYVSGADAPAAQARRD